MTHALEIIFLVLVVLHALQHLPEDLRHAERVARKLIERIFGVSVPPPRFNSVAEFLTALATAVTFAPLLYYSFECAMSIAGAA